MQKQTQLQKEHSPSTRTNRPALLALILIISLLPFLAFPRAGDEKVVPEKSVEELRKNFGYAKTTWDPTTGTLTFTASGSINFSYESPFEYKRWIWRVPTSVKVIAIGAGVTINGGFHTYANTTIKGAGRNTSFMFGTNQRRWADDPNQDGSVDLDEWNYAMIRSYAGDLVIQDLEIKNPYAFHVLGAFKNKAEIRRCDFIDDRGGSQNHSDGVSAGHGSLIEDCYFSTSDDNIKFYPSEMTVRNCTFNMIKNSIPFQFGWGTLSFATNGKYVVENCTVTGTSGSEFGLENMPIFSYRGATPNDFKTCIVTGCTFKNPNASLFEMRKSGMNLDIDITNSIIDVARFAKHFESNIDYSVCGTTNKTNYYDCRSSASGNVTVRARGITGTERIEIRRNDQVVGEPIVLKTDFREYTVPVPTLTGNFKVAFVNDDGGSRDVVVDWLEVASTRRQAEQRPVNTGAWTPAGCGTGGNTQMMHCNGYIDFGNFTANQREALANSAKPIAGQKETEGANWLKTYPNPASEQLTVEGSADYRVAVYDLTGQPVMRYDHLRGVQQIDISHLRPGVYLMQMQDAQQRTLSRRVIVE